MAALAFILVKAKRRLSERQEPMGLVDDWGEYLKGHDESITQPMLLLEIRTGLPLVSENL